MTSCGDRCVSWGFGGWSILGPLGHDVSGSKTPGRGAGDTVVVGGPFPGEAGPSRGSVCMGTDGRVAAKNLQNASRDVSRVGVHAPSDHRPLACLVSFSSRQRGVEIDVFAQAWVGGFPYVEAQETLSLRALRCIIGKYSASPRRLVPSPLVSSCALRKLHLGCLWGRHRPEEDSRDGRCQGSSGFRTQTPPKITRRLWFFQAKPERDTESSRGD